MRRTTITVVGAGNVGATVAHTAATRQLGNIVLVDIVEGMPQGKALDLAEAMPIEGADARIVGTNSYDDTAGSDIVVITAGVPRKPGMSRDDLLATNTKIMKSVTAEVATRSPDAVLVVVANPLDAMVWVAHQVSGFPTQRVMGMAGVLDSTRLRAFIAQELDVSVEDVQAMVLGGHGDTMVPLVRYCGVAGVPLPELLSADRIDALVERTKFGGGEIVKLMGTSAYYAPGTAVTDMLEAIVRDKKRILPCAAWCDREYDVGGYFVGVPAKLGAGGVEVVLELPLTPDERAALDRSVAHVRDLVAATRKLL